MSSKIKKGGSGRKPSAFISYSHKDRKYGAQAKSLLADVGIEAFLAHDDLRVSDEWRKRIIVELKRCDLFVPLVSKNFLASKWAPQEVGFIISRPEVVIAPISLDGTTPFGFISHVQSSGITKDRITVELLVDPLIGRMPRQILPGLIGILSDIRDFRYAEARMAPLVPYFYRLRPNEAQALAEASVGNAGLWSAHLCRTEYLPELVRQQAKNIAPKTLRALKYQIANDKWYKDRD